MQTLQTNYLGTEEIKDVELLTIEGGYWWAIAGALALSAIDNWGDIREGFADGLAGTTRY